VRLVQWFNGLLRLGWFGILIALAGLTAMGFVAWLLFLGLRRGWKQWQLRQLPPTERLYQQMLASFLQQGIPKQPSETPLEYGQRLYARAKAKQAQAANEIAHAYVRWRYGGEPQNLAYLGEKLRIIRSLAGREATNVRWPSWLSESRNSVWPVKPAMLIVSGDAFP
jgi:hypothetical protein